MKSIDQIDSLSPDVLSLRRDIISLCYMSQVGHIPSSLSVTETLYILYRYIIKKNYHDFILSKGHAGPALYAVLRKFKLITEDQYDSYGTFGSKLTSHPTSEIPGVHVSSGALGMGLSIGIGFALANKLNKNKKKVFVLMGDGELNEGSVWESLMFASQFKKLNIIGLVDKNGLQASDFTRNIIRTEPLLKAINELGWSLTEVNGHNLNELKFVLEHVSKTTRPNLIVLNTIKGKGVSFMENNPDWHHRQLSKSEYKQALREINSNL